MAIYIPMSRMGRVSVADFQQVASRSDSEIFVNGCPNRAELKLSSQVQISGISNVGVVPISCRDTVDGKIILCGGCHSEFQHAKEAEDEGLLSEDFIYFTDEDKLIEGTKTFKEKALDWVKAHPFVTAIGVAGTVGAVFGVASTLGVVSALGGYVSSNPATPSPLATKTTNPPSTQATSKPLKLNLDIYNALNQQALNITTTQIFKNGTRVVQQLAVPELAQAKLVFDIDKKHHKHVRVNYTDHFDRDLRDALRTSKRVPNEYNFGKSLTRINARGRYAADKNNDAVVAASHTFFQDRGYVYFNDEIENANGTATPYVTTKDINLFIRSRKKDYHHYSCMLNELRGGQWMSAEYDVKPLMMTEHKIKAGTYELSVMVMNPWGTVTEHRETSFSAKDLVTDLNDDLCLYADTTDLYDEIRKMPGKCPLED